MQLRAEVLLSCALGPEFFDPFSKSSPLRVTVGAVLGTRGSSTYCVHTPSISFQPPHALDHPVIVTSKPLEKARDLPTLLLLRYFFVPTVAIRCNSCNCNHLSVVCSLGSANVMLKSDELRKKYVLY